MPPVLSLPKLTLLALAVGSLSACTNLGERIDRDHAANMERASRLNAKAGQIEVANPVADPVAYNDGIFIGKQTVKVHQETSLPSAFYEPAFLDRQISSLQQFAERITTRTGIPTKITLDAAVAAQRALNPNSNVTGANTGTAAMAPPIVAQPNTMGAAMGMYGNTPQPVQITYSGGTLKGLLDTAASRFGVWWRYIDGNIQFYYTDTKTFTLRAVPGDKAINATVANGNSTGASTTGGSSATTTTSSISTSNSNQTQLTSTLSVWNQTKAAIEAQLSTVGKVVVSPTTNSVTVTDTPDNLAKVSDYIDSQNGILKKQVVIEVTILNVTTTDTDNYGLSWSLVYKDLFRKYGVTNTYGADAGASALSAAIISSSSKWSGSSMVIDALSQQAKVNLDTHTTVTALNNNPTPVQVSKQTTYIASASSTSTTNAGTTSSITPGTVSSGLNMTLLPSVMADGTVIVQFQAEISALRQLRSLTSAGSTIEAPELDGRSFLQAASMKSGETLILSGFEQTTDNLTRSGVGTPKNWLLGGGMKGVGNKEMIVIILTPVVKG